jgi:hypothetical protein
VTDQSPAALTRPDEQPDDIAPRHAMRRRVLPFGIPVPDERVIRGICIGGGLSLILWALLIGAIMLVRRLLA